MTTGHPPSAETPLTSVAQLGAIISNAWPNSRDVEGDTLHAVEQVLEEFPLFEAFQTVDVPYAGERRKLRQVLHDQGRAHNYTLTRVLANHQVSLSSLDRANRERAVDVIAGQFDDAAEIGACCVTVISGARPANPEARADALAALEESLAALAERIRPYDGLELLIEPLDFESHKRNTLGASHEALGMWQRLQARGLAFGLCLDSAHLALNGEDSIAAVAAARDATREFHFCNCVTDPSHPLFGDRHLPFGAPGIFGETEVAEILFDLHRVGFLNETRRPRVYCEVWKPDDWRSLDVIAHCAEVLQRGWQRAVGALEPQAG